MENYKRGMKLRKGAENKRIKILQIGAESCLPCHSLRQKIEEWLTVHSEVDGVYLSLEEFPDIAAEEGIFTVPAILVFVDEKLTIQESGYFSLESILAKTEQYLKLLH